MFIHRDSQEIDVIFLYFYTPNGPFQGQTLRVSLPFLRLKYTCVLCNHEINITKYVRLPVHTVISAREYLILDIELILLFLQVYTPGQLVFRNARENLLLDIELILGFLQVFIHRDSQEIDVIFLYFYTPNGPFQGQTLRVSLSFLRLKYTCVLCNHEITITKYVRLPVHTLVSARKYLILDIELILVFLQVYTPGQLAFRSARENLVLDIKLILFFKWADPASTAKAGQPATEVEQAPCTPSKFKNQFNILSPQCGLYQILS